MGTAFTAVPRLTFPSQPFAKVAAPWGRVDSAGPAPEHIYLGTAMAVPKKAGKIEGFSP